MTYLGLYLEHAGAFTIIKNIDFILLLNIPFIAKKNIVSRKYSN